MIRIYLDWNVISQMKNGAHSMLYSLLLENKKNILIFYSGAHIDDINKNINSDINEITKSDLKFLSELTSNNCLFLDMNNILNTDFIDPLNYLKDRLEERELFEGNLSDKLISYIDEIEQFNPNLAANYKNFLHTDCDFDIGPLKNIFPELKGGSFKNILDSMFELFKNMNNTERYSGLRKLIQNGLSINRDKIFNSDNPFEQIKSVFTKTGITYDNFIETIRSNLKQDENWYNQITNTYINLDMFGFKEDKVFVKPNKSNTFKNIINDASHAAFGSICHYFITNDNRAYEKTKATYNVHCINTNLCKPDEAYNSLKNMNDFNILGKIFDQIPQEYDNGHKSEVLLNNDSMKFTMIISQIMFIYFFNKIYVPEFFGKDRYLILSTDKPTNGNFYYRQEIENLVSNIDDLLDIQKENRVQFSDDEFETIKNNGDWKRNYCGTDIMLTLTQYDGFIQLYIYL